MSLIENARSYRENKRLPSWKADATAAFSQASAFSSNVSAHLDRWVYELLQNAEDAEAGKCKLVLTKDTLIVADNGNGLVDESVIELSNPFFSNKGAGVIGRKGVGFSAAYSLTASPYLLSGEECLTFCPERFASWMKEKRELSELRENAAEYPYLYALVPFGTTADECKTCIPAASHAAPEGWTQVCLPFRRDLDSDETSIKIANVLLGLDYRFLLTFKHLRDISVERDNIELLHVSCDTMPTVSEITGSKVYALSRFDRNNGSKSVERYAVWERIVVAPDDLLTGSIADSKTRKLMKETNLKIVAPLDKDGTLVPEKSHVSSKFIVFYPTDDDAPTRALLHAEFLVESNRKRILSPTTCSLNKWLLDESALFFVEQANALIEEGEWLSALALLQPTKETNFSNEGVGKVFGDTLRETAAARLMLPKEGGGSAPLGTLYIPPPIHSAAAVRALIGMRRPSIQPIAMEMVESKEARDVLRFLGCEVIEESTVLDWLTKPPKSLDSGFLTDWAWQAWLFLTDWFGRNRNDAKRLKEMRVLPVDGALSCPGPQLCWFNEKCESPEEALPEWLPVHWLPKVLAERVKLESNEPLQRLLGELGIRVFHHKHLLDGLRRAVHAFWEKSEDQREHPERFLEYLMAQSWLDDALEQGLYGIDLSKVPVRTTGGDGPQWAPAQDCYFGQDWNNSDLAVIYRDCHDTIWLAPDAEEKQRLYRSLGVCEYPRLVSPAQVRFPDEFWQRVKNNMPPHWTTNRQSPESRCQNRESIEQDIRVFDRFTVGSLESDQQRALLRLVFTHWGSYQAHRDLRPKYSYYSEPPYVSVENSWWHEIKTSLIPPQQRGAVEQSQPLNRCWLRDTKAKWASSLFPVVLAESISECDTADLVEWLRQNHVIRLSIADTTLEEWEGWLDNLVHALEKFAVSKQAEVVRSFYAGFLEFLRTPRRLSYPSRRRREDVICWDRDTVVKRRASEVWAVQSEPAFERWRAHVPLVLVGKDDLKDVGELLMMIRLDERMSVTLHPTVETKSEPAVQKRFQDMLPFLFSYEKRIRRRTQVDIDKWRRLHCLSAPEIEVVMTLDKEGQPQERQVLASFGDPKLAQVIVTVTRLSEADTLANALQQALNLSSETKSFAEHLLNKPDHDAMRNRLINEKVESYELEEDVKEYLGQDDELIPDSDSLPNRFQPTAPAAKPQLNDDAAEFPTVGSRGDSPVPSAGGGRTGTDSNASANQPLELRGLDADCEFVDLSAAPPREPGTRESGSDTARHETDDVDPTHREASLDHESRLRIEALSREFVERELRKLEGQEVKIKQMDHLNEGFDIQVERSGRLVRIEVKGHLETVHVEEFTAPEYRCSRNAGADYDWELWSVQNLSRKASRPVSILRIRNIPVEAWESKTYKVRLEKCEPVELGK